MTNPLTGYLNGHLCIVDGCGRFGPFGFTRSPGIKPTWGCAAHKDEARAYSQAYSPTTTAPEAESPPWN